MADFSNIIQEINTNLPDNNAQSITAAKLRTTLIDLTNTIDTVQDDFEAEVYENMQEQLKFKTDEVLGNTSIDDSCDNGLTTDVAAASAVMDVKQKTRDLTLTTTPGTPYMTIEDGYYIVGNTGLYGLLINYPECNISIYDVTGYRFVRFLGVVSKSSHLSSGFCFTDENDNLQDPQAANVIFNTAFSIDSSISTTYAEKEYIIEVPAGAKWFKTTSGLNVSLFPTFAADYYCYLEKGTILSDYVKETDDTNLVNPPVDSVAMAKDTMDINGYIDYPNYTETLSTASKTYAGWVRGDTGAIAGSSTTNHTEVELNGEDKIRFLNIEWYSGANTTSGWAFYYANGTYIPGSGSIADKTPELESGARMKEYIVDVPEGAKLFKCTTTAGSGVVTPDNFYCYLIKGNKINSEINKAEFNCYEPLFRYDFLDITNEGGTITPNFDTSKLIGNYSNSNLTANGYAPGTSFSGYVNINKVCAINNFSCKAKIKLQDFTAKVGIGSIDALSNGSRGSQITFDFNGKLIQVAKKTHGTTQQTSMQYSWDITSVIDTADTYIIEVGRINRSLYAKITNFITGASIKYVAPVSDVSPNGVAAPDSYPIGCFYDTLTFFQTAGTQAYFQDITCFVPSNVKVAFLGDSITEGYGVKPSNCWAGMACEYLGNSINMGRNGSKIDILQTQVEDMLPIIKPKYAVVTIGTNDTTATPSTIDSTKLNTLVSTLKDMNIIPIVNTIYRRISTYDSKVAQCNADILSLHVMGCRFDIATSVDFDLTKAQNTSLYLSDSLHLNQAGNDAIYKRFMDDIGYNLKGNCDYYN